MPRIFGFSLLLAAPLSIRGLSEILKFMKVKEERKHLLAFSLFLFILFAFNYGIIANLVNSVTGEVKDMSLYTPIETILKSNDLDFKRLAYWEFNCESDSTFNAVKWFFIHQNPNKSIFADFIVHDNHFFDLYLPNKYGGKTIHNLIQPKKGNIEYILKGRKLEHGYIFLAYHNIWDDFIYVNKTYYKTSDYLNVFEGANRVYDSGGGRIYWE